VYLDLNLTSTYPTFKNNINQSLTFQKRIFETDRIGYGGILVYVGFDGNYYAFDMSCPYEVKTTVRVYPNELGQAVCEKCGSVFDISYGIGNPSSGPAKEVLKHYKTNLSGDNLVITAQ
jgi:nitrite reductase/ring-hydroxylating ferredoxin subunit